MMLLRKIVLIVAFSWILPLSGRSIQSHRMWFIGAGPEQLHYTHFNLMVSCADEHYAYFMGHSIHASYSPWGRQSQFYYSFDYTRGITGAINAGILTDFKLTTFFVRPEVGIILGPVKAMIGYNFPLQNPEIGNRGMLTAKIYFQFWINPYPEMHF